MKGFSLIEALIAVAILTVALVGPMFTASRAIVAAEVSRDQLTASYLAQENIECVRAVRDDDYLAAYQAHGSDVSSTAWNTYLSSPTGTCTTAPYTDPSPGAASTVFTRALQANAVSATEERIVSTVSWVFHDTPYSVTITDHLTSWQ